MSGLNPQMRNDRRGRLACTVVVVVCLALLALLTVIQVAHVHSVNTDADHCPLCIVLHTAAPVFVAAAAVLLVRFEAFTPAFEVRPIGISWRRQLFIRPPPTLCAASFRSRIQA